MAVEVELEVLKGVVHKLDSSLEKISEVSNSIGKLLAVHNERIGQLEKTSERRINDLEKLEMRLSSQTKEIVEKIEKLEKTIETEIKDTTKELREQHNQIQEDLQNEIKLINTRLNVLETWRWYVVGAATAVGFLIGNFSDILKFLK